MKNLKIYFKTIIKLQEAKKKKEGTPYIGRIENPEDLCNTLWIPLFSGNRTATYNLNHKLNGFNENGELWGENGNCGTPYRIVEVPSNWGKKELSNLCKIVAEKLNKEESYPIDRVLKADGRINIIIETIKNLS